MNAFFSKFSAQPRSTTSLNPVLFCQSVCLPLFTALLSVTNDKAWFVSGTFEDFGEHRSTCNIDHFPQRPEPYQEEVKGVGTVRLKVKQYLGNSELVSEGEVTLERVLYIPTMAHNLVCSLLVAGAGRVYNPENAIYGDGHRNGIRTPSPPPSPLASLPCFVPLSTLLDSDSAFWICPDTLNVRNRPALLI